MSRRQKADGNSIIARCDGTTLSHLVLTRKRNGIINFYQGGKLIIALEISEIRTNCVRVNMLLDKKVKALRGELEVKISKPDNSSEPHCGDEKVA